MGWSKPSKAGHTEAEVDQAFADLARYRDALAGIVAVLGPYGSEHTSTCIDCMGCRYEWNEALTTAMDALAGVDPARALRHRTDPETARRERHDAWRSAGFVEADDGTWTKPSR